MTTTAPAPRHGQIRVEGEPPPPGGSANTVLRLYGEIDSATTPALREHLFAALRPGLRLLVIDLSGITFCDVAGLAVLVGTRHRAERLGMELRLVGPRPQMRGTLRVTGLERVLTIHPTLARALADGPGETGCHPTPTHPRPR
ncbi:STAS domain-containing protein [Halostreptopolyspora alba]|uniref:STAS domain-containing protein n=1 Tax=Halostreptopolyspora alba TaxID=2487137 RepID=UPI00267F1E66